MFGLGCDEDETIDIVQPCVIPIPEQGIVFITGPSGAGKSTVLRLLAERLRATHTVVMDDLIDGCEGDDPAGRAVIDCIGGSIDQRLQLLSQAGLAEARLLVRPVGVLSEGQGFRLRLARLFGRAKACDRRSAVLVDEFAASLDSVTAQMVAGGVRKLMSSRGESTKPDLLVLATVRDELIDDVKPDVVVLVDLDGAVRVLRVRQTMEPRRG